MTATATKTKRPGWALVISLFFMLSSGWALLSFALIHSGFITLTEAQSAYFNSLQPSEYLPSLFFNFLSLVGAIALFRLSKIAFYCFAASFIANTLLTTWKATTLGAAAAFGNASPAGAAVGLATLAAVSLYTQHLKQKGILR